MDKFDVTQTMAYSTETLKQENIRRILMDVCSALEEREIGRASCRERV